MRRKWLSLLLILPLLLTGCWDSRELEESNYLIAIGLDKGKSAPLAVTFVLARPDKSATGGTSKGEGGESGDGGDEGGDTGKDGGQTKGMISVEAPSLTGAAFFLTTVMSRPTTLSQAKMILLSEELARDVGMIVLDEAARNQAIRRSTMLVVTKGRAADFLRAIAPGPGQLTDFAAIQSAQEVVRAASIPRRARVNDFLIHTSTAYQEPVTYYAFVTRGRESRETAPEALAFSGSANYSRSGGPAIDFAGSAAFRGTKMVGVLSTIDTRALLMVHDEFRQVDLELPDPSGAGVSVGLRITRGRNPEIRTDLKGGRPRLFVKIRLEGEVLTMPTAVNYTLPSDRRKLESAVEALIQDQVTTFFTKTQAWGTDVGGLGRLVARQFPTVTAWDQYNWPRRYRDAQIDVAVEMKLRRFGLQLDPAVRGRRD
jgi:spore germination protein KC